MMAEKKRPSAVRTFSPKAAARAGKLPRICLVTAELVGPFKNGGLGTSMTGLVEFMAAQGAEVTVLYTGEVSGDLAEWTRKYKTAGIKLETLSEAAKPAMVGPLVSIGWTNAWLVFLTLRNRDFDVIHFNDTVGEGVYCFLAKRQGMAFAGTLLTLALHSPTEWILESNGHPSNWAGFCCFTTAERLSIANTDLLWGPSLYLLNWIKSRDYALPGQVFNQQYLIPTDDLFGVGKAKTERAAVPAPQRDKSKPSEIVFFGRLEERKGIRLFVNTITKMGAELERRGISVLFMGKPSSVNGMQADEYLGARSAKWGFKWRIESDFNQQQAVDYLRSNPCVAVMASPVDNSPCTVYEALRFGLPFIAARTGGIPELIHADDQKQYLFDYSVESLSKALQRVISGGTGVVRPSIPVAENQARWLAMHRDWKSFMPAPAQKAKPKKWQALIDHYSTAAALDKSLASIRSVLGAACVKITVLQRDFAPISEGALPGIEIIDDASDVSAGAALRKMKSHAAESVLFLRSGVQIRPGAKQVLERALLTKAHVSAPFAHLEAMDATMPVLAASAALSLLEGDFDSGGFVFDYARLAKLLGPSFNSLERTLPYLGIIEAVHGARGEVWPVAEAALSAEHGADLILPQMPEAKRAAAYANMRHLDSYQSLSIGRRYYRALTPAAAPAPPSMVQNVIAATAKEIKVLVTPKRRRFVERAIKAICGDKSEMVTQKLKRLVRGG
jgi:glycosyltransferase involved in cell wall biosynthesis